jgi:hypothetical protein
MSGLYFLIKIWYYRIRQQKEMQNKFVKYGEKRCNYSESLVEYRHGS